MEKSVKKQLEFMDSLKYSYQKELSDATSKYHSLRFTFNVFLFVSSIVFFGLLIYEFLK